MVRAPREGVVPAYPPRMRTLVAIAILVACAPAHADRPKLTYLAADLSAAEVAELAAAVPNVRIVSGLDRRSALAHAAQANGADARLLHQSSSPGPRSSCGHTRLARASNGSSPCRSW